MYYNQIYLKNIENYLSKLYIGKYSEVKDVIYYTQNTVPVSINGKHITMCASGCFVT